MSLIEAEHHPDEWLEREEWDSRPGPWIEEIPEAAYEDRECLVPSEEVAENHLEYLHYWKRLRAARQAHAQKQLDKVQTWLDRELEPIDRKIAWHERGLKTYLWTTGKKTLRLINGTLKRIAGRERVEITDEARLPESFFRIKTVRTPDKKAILSHIRQSGEIPDGTDLVRNEDTLKIETH